MDDGDGNGFVEYVFPLDGDPGEITGRHLLDGALGEHAPLLDQDLLVFRIDDIFGGPCPLQQIGRELTVVAAIVEADGFRFVKVAQQVLGRVAEGFEQHRDREFPASVDSDVHDVLGIDFHVDP